MYAIIEVGGHQWKVSPGTQLDINRVPTAVGAQHAVERVLLASDGQQVHVGRPYLPGAQVICEVLSHRLGEKTISYHFRRRENWRKTVGHRQPLTRVIVKDIRVSETATAEVPAQAAATVKPRARKARAPETAATIVKKARTPKSKE